MSEDGFMDTFLRKLSATFGLSKKYRKAETKEDGNRIGTEEPPVQNRERGVEGVGAPKEKEKGKTETKVRDRGKVFVGGLSQTITSEILRDHFSRIGSVADCVVMRYPKSQKSRGFGFVTFVDPADAEVALQLKVNVLDGKPIEVRPFDSVPRSKRRLGHRIFLGGIPYEMTEEQLKTFFIRYGEVIDVVIPRTKEDSKPKGIAFISFSSEDAAARCLSEGFIFLLGKRVQITKAVSKDRSKASDLQTEEECVDDVDDDDDDNPDGVLLGDCNSSLDSGELLPGFENALGFSAQANEDCSRQEKSCPNAKNKTEGGDTMERWKKELEKFPDIDTDKDRDESEDDDNSAEVSECESARSRSGLFNDYLGNVGSLDEICVKLRTVLGIEEKLGIPLASTSNHAELTAVRKKPEPFIFKRKDGLYECPLCMWLSPNGSAESFLNHCKTPAHREKMKERHPLRDCQKSKPWGTIQPNDHANTNGSTLMTTPIVKEREDGGKQQSQPQSGKKENGNVKKGGSKGAKQAESAAGSSKSKTKKGEVEKTPNPELQAFLKGIVTIDPQTQSLTCNLCSVMIPFSKDFGALMKSATCHLHSKKHLNKVAEMESSKGAPSGKNVNTPEGMENGVAQKPKAEGQEGVQKTKKQKTSVATNHEKTKRDKKNVNDSKPARKFLCLECNYTIDDQDMFNIHLNSTLHKNVFKLTGLTPSDVEFDQCKICKSFFHGSLISINKHYLKCSKV